MGNIRSGHAASDNPDTDHDIDDNADDDDGGDGDGDNDADDVIVMVLIPIVVGILPSKFHAGSAVINGSPRGSLRTSGSARDDQPSEVAINLLSQPLQRERDPDLRHASSGRK
jgi:hypothetical protein